MLLTPRAYKLHQDQLPRRELWSTIRERFDPVAGWHDLPASTQKHIRKMLLIHQTGSVRLGEVVRYSLTYKPSEDRIVPTPPTLFVKVRNSSAVALRAAYLHGPYTLYVSCYPAGFDPNHATGNPEEIGYPQFESMLKAGSSWSAQIKVPDNIHESFASGSNRRQSGSQGSGGSVTWIIEIASQVLFSSSVAVQYEVVVGRDEKSVDFGWTGMGGVSHASPGSLSDFQLRRKDKRAQMTQPNGVYSKAVLLKLDDTASLWNTPALPGEEKEKKDRDRLRANPVLNDGDPVTAPMNDEDPRKVLDNAESDAPKKSDRTKIHLVILTHGLHSNLGADMLYLKDSIDTASRQAKLDRSMRKAKEKASKAKEDAEQSPRDKPRSDSTWSEATISGGQANDADDAEEDEDDEEVIVRGFPGNAVRTERGIQYLGKRLAKYVLAMTYPDQPYLPVKKKSMTRSISNAFGGSDKPQRVPSAEEMPRRTVIRKEPVEDTKLAYQITSISFIGHSLGGLVQTYAIAYIQKHSPEFFQLIRPINFVALASPFLGLSNENPLYVKFALDFGLVGRTGQDLGLTWRAPTMVRSGWGAMIAGIGSEGQRKRSQLEPKSKPLLRILPSGPAHQVLRMFRNRTVYSNVVNDGIVPLRTSCLLFLDWRGLDRVENARRDNGLIGTVAGWGWAELTGQHSATPQQLPWRGWFDSEESSDDKPSQVAGGNGGGTTVPQPSDDAVQDHTNVSAPSSPIEERRSSQHGKRLETDASEIQHKRSNSDSGSHPLSGFFSLLKPSGSGGKSPTPVKPNSGSHKPNNTEPKKTRIYKRSQTVKFDANDSDGPTAESQAQPEVRPVIVRGESVLHDSTVIAPPKTTVFESAGDILNPPLPSKEYLTDPTSRARTIFHDRVYHPEDIPQPILRPRSFLRRTRSNEGKVGMESSVSSAGSGSSAGSEQGGMKVEEKIARAYHHDLSWRKVLVRLEPDAHNNIVVRRMFSNAHGWPVVKHLVDTHFSDSEAARLADSREAGIERAKPMDQVVGGSDEVNQPVRRTTDEVRAAKGGSGEERDAVPEMHAPKSTQSSTRTGRLSRTDSAAWDDRFFNSDDDDDDEDDYEDFAPPRSPAPQPPTSGGAAAAAGEAADSGKAEGTEPLKIDTAQGVVLPVRESPAVTSTSEVGLRKSVEEQMRRSREQQREREQGREQQEGNAEQPG